MNPLQKGIHPQKTDETVDLKKKYADLLQKNEAEANTVIAKIQLVIAGVFILFGGLDYFGIISVRTKAIYTALILSGVAMAAISAAMLTAKGDKPKPWLKHLAATLFLLSALAVNIVTGYRFWLLYAVPIILSIRLCNRRFTTAVTLGAMGMTLFSAFANAYFAQDLRIMDLNLVSFTEPGTLNYYSWLYNAVVDHGYDPLRIFINGLRLSALPNCIIFFFIMLASHSVIRNAAKILLRETEEHEREMRILRISMTDGMTGLLNRRAYDEDFDGMMAENPENLVFAMFDVDNLKTVNDTCGHLVGDELILGAAQCLKDTLEPYGKLYRWGGDEFAAVFYADEKHLQQIQAELADRVSHWSGKNLSAVSLSSGYARAAEIDPPATKAALEALADGRMYAEKDSHHDKSAPLPQLITRNNI